MERREGVEHFWTPPPGERLLGMVRFKDMIVVATDGGVYVITDHSKPFPDLDIRKITSDVFVNGVNGQEPTLK